MLGQFASRWGALAAFPKFAHRGEAHQENWRLLLAVGAMGGFTTFSAFSWDALQLVNRGEWGGAALYVGGSVVLSVLAVAIGFQIGR